MRIGFTGTRHGMTLAQRRAVADILATCRPTHFHHGDCVGADDEAANMAADLEGVFIVCHPPIDPELRAFNQKHAEERTPKSYFARNRAIVDAADALIAAPRQTERPPPKTGGGTWYTVEHAERRGRIVYVVWPDGRVQTLAPPTPPTYTHTDGRIGPWGGPREDGRQHHGNDVHG